MIVSRSPCPMLSRDSINVIIEKEIVEVEIRNDGVESRE